MWQQRIVSWLRADKVGLSFLSLTWLIFFSRILSGRFIYFLDDLKIIYFPLEVVYAQFQNAWQLPVWSNLFGFGQPLLAWGQLGFFTPIHLILRLFQVPALELLQISVMVYYALGLLGLYIFIRRIGLSQLSAVMGSVVYAFSGFNIGHLNHVNFYTATMVLPWLLVAIHWFLNRPTARRAVAMSIVAAAMVVSAQPQVVLYCFIIASIIGLVLFLNKFSWKALVLTLAAAALALALSSFSILPLIEFLPLTERGTALPETELFEFSYPPNHAITLIAPYFFGDHEYYWGAKGFQELAAFTGILPLLLASLALLKIFEKKDGQKNNLRRAGLILLLVGIGMALGKHSLLYTWIIEHRILGSLTIPGRFVFFVNFGIALLAAVGLSDFQSLIKKPWLKKLPYPLASFFISSMLFLPFTLAALKTSQLSEQFLYLLSTYDWQITLAIISLALYLVLLIWPKNISGHAAGLIIVIGTTVTLLYLSWSYNPMTNRSELIYSPFANELQETKDSSNIPPRLYSRADLLTSEPTKQQYGSPAIGPNLSLWQPFILKPSENCVIASMSSRQIDAVIVVAVQKEIGGEILAKQEITGQDIILNNDQTICFDNLSVQEATPIIISFTADKPTDITLAYSPLTDRKSGYIVRVKDPTVKQIEKSQKEIKFDVKTEPANDSLNENILIARNLQAAYGASGARWISALSIQNYREFIELFFANDKEPFSGDGEHVLTSFRKYFDLAGVTHFGQKITNDAADNMAAANFNLLAEHTESDTKFRFYENPQAFPKAFTITNYEFLSAPDHVRAKMQDPNFDPVETVIISGPKPPNKELGIGNMELGTTTTEITTYSDTRVDVEVISNQDTWLIVADSTTPNWQTFIDDQPAAYYSAYSIFKAARVPAGEHVVSFRYQSPAIEKAKILTLAGLAIAILILCVGYWRR